MMNKESFKVKRIKGVVAFVLACIIVCTFSACGTRKSEEESLTVTEAESGDKEEKKQNIEGADKLTKGEKKEVETGELEKENKELLLKGTGEFSFELMRECDESGKNVLISPTSVMFALGMTANGGAGATLKEMESVLGGDGVSIGEINAFYKEYADKLKENEDIKISIANSIWINKEILTTVKDTFLSTCDSFYGAEVYRAIFNDETIKLVNKWVEENTDGMIKELLKEFNGNEAMMLINAIAFDGKWVEIYYEDQVRDTIFTTAEGEETNIQGMYSDERAYIEDDNTTGFIKDYKGGYRFVAMLPSEDMSIDEYVDSLTYDKYKKLMESERDVKVSAMLPKFQYDYSKEMKDVLKKMGMPSAFERPRADFSNMTEDELVKLYIGKVLHKTYIEVAEEGTRAAAVTAVIMDSNAAIMEEEIKNVFLDRPFVYMIIDGESEMPLFMGVVRNI